MCHYHSFTLPHISTWKTCSGKLWDVMTGAKRHHSKRQLAQAPDISWSPVTFKRGKSQLLSFFSPQTNKVDFQVLGSLCKSKFPWVYVYPCHRNHAIARHQLNCNVLKWVLNFLHGVVSPAAYKMALLRNTVVEIIVIEMCHDARVGVTHLQK